VRQAPITVQNVVTYDVVVSVENPELLLKPGMTANVNVVTASRDKVIRVPIDALRFAPAGQPPADSAALDGAVGRQTRVWVQKNRSVSPVAITTGLSDGSWVEVAEGDLQPGDRVVTDEIRSAGSRGAAGSSSHGAGGIGSAMVHMPH
jgi:HlyD family secretion protein